MEFNSVMLGRGSLPNKSGRGFYSLLFRRSRYAVLLRSSGRAQRTQGDRIAHSLIDLCAVAPFLRRQGHNRLVDLGLDRQPAIGGPNAYLCDQE
jgi:hypothetical protein